MNVLLDFGIAILTSFIGSMFSLVLWMHYDLEGWWEQRRLANGKKLDERQLRAAKEHGKHKR